MHSSDERSFILSILLLPFLIFVPLLIFILNNSSPPLIESQPAPPSSTPILLSEPAKTENPTTRKRQNHMAFRDNANTFITPRNYYGTSTSSGGFQPIAYQAPTPSFMTNPQKYDRGATSSSTSFQSIALTNNNSNNNNRPISATSINTTNQNHGAAAGRKPRFHTDTNHYYYYNNNNTISPPKMEEGDDVQFPKMLDMYSSLPPISSYSSFRKEEEKDHRAAQASTNITRRAAAAAAPLWEVILPIRSATMTMTGFIE